MSAPNLALFTSSRSEKNPTEIARLRFSQRQARLIRRVGIQSGALGFVAGALAALVLAWGYSNV